MEQATTATASSSHFEQLQSALAAVAEATVPLSNDRGDTFEVPRYRRNDADAVTRAVLTRSRKLGGYIYQLVRVVRLAALCASPRTYHHFFWSRLAQLGPSYFQNAIREAKANNRLPDSMIRISHESSGERVTEVIEFLEPAMLAGGTTSPYRLSYGNMPPVVALLEIMNYTLGPAVLDALFKPLQTTTIATASAVEIAQRLNREFSEWLKLALGADFANRKAHTIERFLAGQSGGKERRFGITDQVILDFWLSLNTGGSGSGDKGLKRFRNAAQTMLRYHRAVQLAAADFVEISGSSGYSDSEQWRSPIIDLFSPLCRPVKWFRNKEDQLKDLSNYLDGCDLAMKEDWSSLESIASETSIPASETAFRVATLTMVSRLTEVDDETGSLMGKDRFDLSFLRTLLRVDVFGAVQNQLTSALKKKKTDRLPLGQIVSLLPPETENGYILRKRVYSDIRDDLVQTMLASIDQFARRRADDLDASATAAILTLVNKLCLLKLCPSSVLQFLSGRPAAPAEDFDEDEFEKEPDEMDWSDVHRTVGKNLPGAYGRKTGNAAVDEFIVQVKEAKNQRQGFRPTDLSDPATQEAHNQAAFALVSLLTELDTLGRSLEKFTLIRADTFSVIRPDTFSVDRQIFADAFADIYGA
jgi:hypothetical protein